MREETIRDKYKKYIATTKWKAISKLLRTWKGHCEFCGNLNNLLVHHITYDRVDFDDVGSEYLSDIAIICRNCHNKSHRKDYLQIITETKEECDSLIEIFSKSTFGYDCNYKGYYIAHEQPIQLKNLKLRENNQREDENNAQPFRLP